jgi:hypothetical protein
MLDTGSDGSGGGGRRRRSLFRDSATFFSLCPAHSDRHDAKGGGGREDQDDAQPPVGEPVRPGEDLGVVGHYTDDVLPMRCRKEVIRVVIGHPSGLERSVGVVATEDMNGYTAGTRVVEGDDIIDMRHLPFTDEHAAARDELRLHRAGRDRVFSKVECLIEHEPTGSNQATEHHQEDQKRTDGFLHGFAPPCEVVADGLVDSVAEGDGSG